MSINVLSIHNICILLQCILKLERSRQSIFSFSAVCMGGKSKNKGQNRALLLKHITQICPPSPSSVRSNGGTRLCNSLVAQEGKPFHSQTSGYMACAEAQGHLICILLRGYSCQLPLQNSLMFIVIDFKYTFTATHSILFLDFLYIYSVTVAFPCM